MPHPGHNGELTHGPGGRYQRHVTESNSRSLLARVHSVGGGMLVAYLAFHLWELAAATSGREAFVARAAWWGGPWARVLAVLVLLPLVVHALAGARRVRVEAGHREAYGTAGTRRLQWLTAVIAALFLAVHLVHVGRTIGIDGGGARAAYDRLRTDLGEPGWLSLYVVGIGAVCLHLAGGLAAAVDRLSLRVSPQVARLRRVLIHVGAALAFLVAAHQLGYFAAGVGTFAPVGAEAGATAPGPGVE